MRRLPDGHQGDVSLITCFSSARENLVFCGFTRPKRCAPNVELTLVNNPDSRKRGSRAIKHHPEQPPTPHPDDPTEPAHAGRF